MYYTQNIVCPFLNVSLVYTNAEGICIHKIKPKSIKVNMTFDEYTALMSHHVSIFKRKSCAYRCRRHLYVQDKTEGSKGKHGVS